MSSASTESTFNTKISIFVSLNVIFVNGEMLWARFQGAHTYGTEEHLQDYKQIHPSFRQWKQGESR